MQRDGDLKETLDSVSDVLRDLRVNAIDRRGSSNIQINGGGVGVWIATVCCALMLGMGLIGAMVIVDLRQQIGDANSQIRDLRDYLSAIYAQAPHLKPEPKE